MAHVLHRRSHVTNHNISHHHVTSLFYCFSKKLISFLFTFSHHQFLLIIHLILNMAYTCSICFEQFNASSRKPILCPFDSCYKYACRACYQTFLCGDDVSVPKCLFCNTQFTHSQLQHIGLTKSFLTGDFAKHQQDILFAQEHAMLPAAQAALNHDKLLASLDSQIKQVQTQIKTLTALKNDLLHSRRLFAAQPDSENFIHRCAHYDCNGFPRQVRFLSVFHSFFCINIMYAQQIMKHTRSKHAQITRHRRKTRRSRKFAFDPNCWGKNKPLEQLWTDLSSFLSAVVIYKGSKPYEIVKLQQPREQLSAFDADPQVVAILSAHPGAKNAYETILYPKAKDKTVDYVIANHTKFFKPVPGHPIKKLRVPH